ncbi:hypothetical protein VTK73DRAFT_9632 [Phialemonium thermophilum]|uniref:Major facilitator superfamily (MFS) profile domain-containing protein n=1 Tax=Phialemonium thermophilum TaxID=223376 RepID=A0ABR3W1D8_9PEZI
MSASETSPGSLEAAAGSTSADSQHEKLSPPAVGKPDKDPHVVAWDGPDDPQNPRNWPRWKKNVHVGIASIFTLNANLAATMFAPGAQDLAREFGVTSSIVVSMTVSLYVLGFGLGPLLLAPLSELYGRLRVYYACNAVFVAFTLGCALSTDVAMFTVFRFLCGCAASGPTSIGGGTVADLVPVEDRGRAMALFAMGPILGPVIGPIIGGFVSQDVGWRWTFRIIVILAGLIALATVGLMRETNAAVLLQRKAERLRAETGNDQLVPDVARCETPRQMLRRAVVRPVKMLVFSPIVLLLSLYAGLVFGLVFLLFATFPSVFTGTYGFSAGTSGLAYLGLGIGMVAGLVLFSVLSDRILQRRAARGGGASRPEDRLILIKWFAPITPLGCFVYGWSAHYQVHWIVPILGTTVIGLGALFVFIPGQVYLVDAFGTAGAASALAANMLVRSPFGAFLDLVAPPLYDRLGLGWGNSVLGFVTLAFTPVPWLFYRYGETLRTRFPVDL